MKVQRIGNNKLLYHNLKDHLTVYKFHEKIFIELKWLFPGVEPAFSKTLNFEKFCKQHPWLKNALKKRL